MVSFKATVRQKQILDILQEKGQASIALLTETLDVSGVTVREDLKQLESRRQLVRTRGGALALPERRREMPVELTSQSMADEKRKIGRLAASMVQSGQTVIIDVGSTTTEMARALPSDLVDVTVITNALNIALLLEKHAGLSVVVTGGTLRPLQHSLVAPMGTVLLERLNADIAFTGCNGVDTGCGVTNTNLAEAEIKRAMIESSAKTIVLADHTKLGCVASAFVCDIGEVDLLLTDDGAGKNTLADLRASGLAIEVADGD
ncbi:MAG: DeoR/GlpR family DNA-binding transcription regulator [Rhodospirillales bacterium]|nr:DeoR/GlpR family DNA-binding transcription regulator [Rhodospirillales bacterium]